MKHILKLINSTFRIYSYYFAFHRHWYSNIYIAVRLVRVIFCKRKVINRYHKIVKHFCTPSLINKQPKIVITLRGVRNITKKKRGDEVIVFKWPRSLTVESYRNPLAEALHRAEAKTQSQGRKIPRPSVAPMRMQTGGLLGSKCSGRRAKLRVGTGRVQWTRHAQLSRRKVCRRHVHRLARNN